MNGRAMSAGGRRWRRAGLAGTGLLLLARGACAGPATFETWAEANLHAVARMTALMPPHPRSQTAGAVPDWKAAPAIAGLPDRTVFVYRSADRYEQHLAWKLNAAFVVFATRHFATMAEAEAYLRAAGLIDRIERLKGAIILITPGTGRWSDDDAQRYGALQTVLFDADPGLAAAPDFGTAAYTYAFALDDAAATFFNGAIARNADRAGRLAGVMTVGGTAEGARDQVTNLPAFPTYLPAYLVAPGAGSLDHYLQANDLAGEAGAMQGAVRAFADPRHALLRVFVAPAGTLRAAVDDALDRMMTTTMRVPIGPAGRYADDESPYYLAPRNWVGPDGRTADGIVMLAHEHDMSLAGQKEDRFAGSRPGPTTRWYEFVPQEYLHVGPHDPAAHSVPLVLELHGGGDDPRKMADQCGWLVLQGRERFIMVAPEQFNQMPALLDSMIRAYPAIDPGRIYVSGFSGGGLATQEMLLHEGMRFAAAAPISGATFIDAPDIAAMTARYGTELRAQGNGFRIPLMFMSATQDVHHVYRGRRFVDPITAFIAATRALDGLGGVGAEGYDYDRYPFWGFATVDATDRLAPYSGDMIHTGDLRDGAGVPMMRLAMITDVIHQLNPMQAGLVWDFVHHYRRDGASGAVRYDPR